MSSRFEVLWAEAAVANARLVWLTLWLLWPALGRAGDGVDAAVGFGLLLLAVTAAVVMVGALLVGRGNRLAYVLSTPLLVIAYASLVDYLTRQEFLSATAGQDIHGFMMTPRVTVLYALVLRLVRTPSLDLPRFSGHL